MKYLVIVGISIINLVAADYCSISNCLSEDGCLCASTTSPLATNNTPQFVVLTFDDAVTDSLYQQFYRPVLIGRKNYDGSPISATFFVPHVYSDYERVNNLYNAGFEIGLHSISKNAFSDYWSSANTTTLVQEFGGERQLVSHFANIPIGSIKGARTPNLQLRGNITFDAYNLSGLSYDNSWPTMTNSILFPYTLDYLSSQQCAVGVCPNASYPGFWVAPIVDLKGMNQFDCNELLGCNANGTAEEIFEWLQEQFNRTYFGNRAPQPLLINSAWFSFTENSLEAFILFLDYLETLNEVYLASVNQVIDWMKKPVPLAEYKVEVEKRNASCNARTCVLDFTANEIRYMKSCVACPAVYPWLGNPLGQAT